MPTHTIGTGGDYETIQDWWDAIPEPVDARYIGQCLNQEFTAVGASVLVADERTTTSAHDIILEAAPGCSWADVGIGTTLPLRYTANGARLKAADGDDIECIHIAGNIGHLTIRNLQMKKDSGFAWGVIESPPGTQTVDWRFKNLLLEGGAGGFGNRWVIVTNNDGGDLRLDNVTVIQHNDLSGINLSGTGGNNYVHGCTIVCPSNVANIEFGIQKGDNAAVVTSTVIAGFADDADTYGGGWGATSNYNATTKSDAASNLPEPAVDHNVYEITYDDTMFVQPSDAGGNHDFRLVAGSVLMNAGLLDAVNAPNDAVGTVRGNPPEIGALEFPEEESSAAESEEARDNSPVEDFALDPSASGSEIFFSLDDEEATSVVVDMSRCAGFVVEAVTIEGEGTVSVQAQQSFDGNVWVDLGDPLEAEGDTLVQKLTDGPHGLVRFVATGTGAADVTLRVSGFVVKLSC